MGTCKSREAVAQADNTSIEFSFTTHCMRRPGHPANNEINESRLDGSLQRCLHVPEPFDVRYMHALVESPIPDYPKWDSAFSHLSLLWTPKRAGMEVMDEDAIGNNDRGGRYSCASAIRTILCTEYRLRRFWKVSESAP
jgi:hypothetical protein